MVLTHRHHPPLKVFEMYLVAAIRMPRCPAFQLSSQIFVPVTDDWADLARRALDKDEASQTTYFGPRKPLGVFEHIVGRQDKDPAWHTGSPAHTGRQWELPSAASHKLHLLGLPHEAHFRHP